MKTTLLFAFCIFCVSFHLFAQGEIDDQQKIFYRNESTWALTAYTNGYSFNYRYAKRLDGYRHQVFDFEIAEIKHPKEIKLSSEYIQNSGRFVYGKINQFYTIRLGFGLQKEIYSKYDKGSVAIRYNMIAGASIGILKPIYYEVLFSAMPIDTFADQKFQDIIMRDRIVGKASFSKGLSESVINPGTFVKLGYSFEFSQRDERVRALEVGLLTDIYLREAQIMYSEDKRNFLYNIFLDNRHIFVSLFVSYRWGKVLSKK